SCVIRPSRSAGPCAPRQGVQAECLVEILVRILAVSGARLSAASRQPSLKTPLDIPLHQLVGRKNRPLVEILGPAAEEPIDRGNPQFWTLGMLVWRRRVVNPLEQAPNSLPGRA